MSKVFIAWSGTTDVAAHIKRKIDQRQGYECVIGGNLHEMNSIYVGGTIIDQMKKCDQAILLIQKDPRTGAISSNLMFEWGLSLIHI